MIDPELLEKAQRLPRGSGVYLFKGRRGVVLYVGKAKDLKSRVSQYLSGHDERSKIPFLLSQATDIEVVLTHTEKEALILENSLIKRYAPRYNSQLRDDKNFLHILLDNRTCWPRFRLVRKLETGTLFGPFHSAKKARKTLDFAHRAFGLRTCSDRVLKSRKRPCLLHQLDRCVAPCVDGHTTEEDYAKRVEDALSFLSGKRSEAIDGLTQRMKEAAEREEFERAARLRDLIGHVRTTLEQQQVVDRRQKERDVWAWFREGDTGCVVVLPVRGGLMLDPKSFFFDEVAEDDAELLSSWLNQWYGPSIEVPSEILVQREPIDVQVLQEVLAMRSGHAIRIHAPKRGEKKRLLDLASTNAKDRYRRTTTQEERVYRALDQLASLAGLHEHPKRIECFDNSNLQGKHPVASQVVFIDGSPAKKEYRSYHIKHASGRDDYESMREVLTRRLKRGWKEQVFPDLLVVDGGRGQLGIALQVLEDLGLEQIPVLGLAKARTEKRQGQVGAVDKVVLPSGELVRLEDHNPALNLLRHLRNESHRFAIGFHRRTRSKSTITSKLDEIDGIGPARRRALLKHFGSLGALKKAEVSAISEVPGVGAELAQKIAQTLSEKP